MSLRLLLVAAICPWLPKSASANDPFTLVALPDTQNYANDSSNALLFTQQTQWIADQVQNQGNPRNIQFVTHLGDVVSSGDSLTQLQRANTSLSVLDGVIEYSVLPGNHDYASTGNKSSGSDDYIDFFGPQRFAGQSWFGGADPSGNNTYQRFTAGGYDFIHLALEWQPTLNVPFRDTSPIEWAQSVIDANPSTPVILSTHEYVDDSPPGRSGAGEALWDQLVRRNDQIFMVLNGHFHSVGGTNDGEYHQVSLNDANRPVLEVLSDYQDYPNGGDGWLRLMNFDIPNNQIKFETFSPVLNQFQTERIEDVGAFASQFELGIDFADRLVPVILPPNPNEPPELVPDYLFRNGVNGYNGNRDKELRSSGGDSFNGQETSISVDGDDGSPGRQPNHGLIAFEGIIGPGASQLPGDAEIERAVLTLEVFNAGSGFSVHELLINWSESSTWQSFGSGVQANNIEAVATPIDSFGSNNGSSNVDFGTLEIDVTSTIAGYLDGSLSNFGWALVPFANGTNGIDFFTSEFEDFDLRPSLQIFLEKAPGDFDRDGEVDGTDYLVWQRGFSPDPLSPTDLENWQTGYSSGSAESPGATIPEPSAWFLILAGLPVIHSLTRLRTPAVRRPLTPRSV